MTSAGARSVVEEGAPTGSGDEPPTGPETPAATGLPTIPGLPVFAGIWVSVAAAALIAMGEIDRLSGQVPDEYGRVLAFSDLMGPGATSQGWTTIADSPIAGAVGGWLLLYLCLDVGFLICYARFGLWLAGHWTWPGRFVLLLAGVDVLEDVLAAVVGLLLTSGSAVPVQVGSALFLASFAKFAVVGLILLATVQELFLRRRQAQARRRDRALWLGLYAQRFSLLTLIPIAVLSIVPGPDILDQLPDVQRRWADRGASPWPVIAAAITMIVLAAGLFVLGRLRSDYVAAKRTDRPDAEVTRPNLALSRLELWLAPALLLLVLALLALWTGSGPVQWVNVAIFAGVPTAIALASGWMRWVRTRRPTAEPTTPLGRRVRRIGDYIRRLEPPPKRPSTYADFRWVCLIGDVCAVAVVIIGGIGLIRSFSAPLILAALPDIAFAPTQLIALVIGVLLSIGSWPLAGWLFDRISLTTVPTRPSVRATLTPGAVNLGGPRIQQALVGVSIVLLVCIAALPGVLAGAGVIVTTLASIGVLSLLVGSLVVLGQSRYAPEIFWFPVLRLRSAPIASLLVLAVVVSTASQVDIAVHPVRHTPGLTGSAGPAERPDTDEAFAAWLTATRDCGRTVTLGTGGREVTLRPMPLVAAEGGGIRAAYWTAAGLDLAAGNATLDSALTWRSEAGDVCRRALFSGGASGGAVGLTVSRFAAAPSARDQVVRLSQSRALAEAVDGLFVRDPFYAATGVPIGVVGRPRGWHDRAALMEQSWSEDAPALSRPYLPGPVAGIGATERPPGVLLLNSTSVATGCRMLVSQVSLDLLTHQPSTRATDGGANGDGEGATAQNAVADANDPARAACDDAAKPAPNSVDLLAAYGADGGPAAGGCLTGLEASTAALLASRFPYVTPSGVIGPCGTWPEQQFVDGGYVENTGLSTVVDLAPWWLEKVRSRNDAQLRRTSGPVELVVPFVVYLDNGTGSDLAAATYRNTSEFLVPPLTILRASRAQSGTAALLQQAAALVAGDRLWDSTRLDTTQSEALSAAVQAWRPRPVVVIHQSTVPAVTAPLGWTLSDSSITTMDRALYQQTTLACEDPATTDLVCRRGYGSLRDLNRLYE